jgi:hypothetical protein
MWRDDPHWPLDVPVLSGDREAMRKRNATIKPGGRPRAPVKWPANRATFGNCVETSAAKIGLPITKGSTPLLRGRLFLTCTARNSSIDPCGAASRSAKAGPRQEISDLRLDLCEDRFETLDSSGRTTWPFTRITRSDWHHRPIASMLVT